MKFGNQLAIVALATTVAVPALAQFRSGGLGGPIQMLARSDIQQELKLTPDQTRKVADLQRSMREGLQTTVRSLQKVPADQRRAKFDAFRDGIDRKVVEILDAKQRKRLNELQLQKDGARALTKPDVIAELRLTDEQRKKIGETLRGENQQVRDLYREVSGGKQVLTSADQGKAAERLAEIRLRTDEALVSALTDQQKSLWAKMKGQPYKFVAERASARPKFVPTAGKLTPAKTNVKPGQK